MKFSEITADQWDELSPYLDTCLLPVTGMAGGEKPYEATEWLERLRDMMDLIEIPFKGRVVTYPAWHYITGSGNLPEMVNEWCESAKRAGFRYAIVVTANKELELACPAMNLSFLPNEDGSLPAQADVSDAIRSMWNGQAV
ncbi:DUF2487 family protein [Paenibacillus harenae]|uniref:DUF2487 family protein n=1 Tax=Paenibacillus harenae TaxID=306543 RepID=UPI00040358FF|nr:DUF2487 family protein [Paenibacillus harenae]